jgi:hypothetical protein
MHGSFLLLLFCTIKGIEEHGKEECFSCLWCACCEKNNYEKFYRYLFLETLNYQDWELKVLPNSGGVRGALLSVVFRGVEHSCSQCQMSTSL